MALLTDVRHSLRQVRRHPAHAVVVIATLALGIGGTTAIFSFVRGVLLRPLPLPDSDRIVLVCETSPDGQDDWCGGSPADAIDWGRQSRTLESVGLARSWPFSVTDDEGRSRAVAGGVATAGAFAALGARAARGRLFEPDDHLEGNDQVVILSDGLWRDRFGADPGIVGKSIRIDDEPHEVIGILPARFEVPYLEQVDLWIPLWAERTNWRNWRGLRPYARLAPGFDLEDARAELATIAARLAAEYPESNAGWGVRVDRLQDRMVASVRPALLLFLGAVGFVLLIACANAANLLLARATSRERELAVRAALGAGPAQMFRALILDTMVLAAAGGILGVLLASWMVSLFVRLAPAGFPRLDEVGLDGVVLFFAVLLSFATTLLAGALPAWHASRVAPETALREGRQGGSSGAAGRVRDLLVVTEVALAFLLLIGAGLLARSFFNLTRWQPGFDTERLVSFSVFPPGGKYRTAERLRDLYARVEERLQALPGVQSVGEVSAGPLFGGGDGFAEFSIEGRPVPAEGAFPTVAWFDCGPEYFRTVGIPLRRGRYFTRQDGPEAPPVAIINETMARRHWKGEDPLGARLHLRLVDRTVEIVGIVADVPPFDPREELAPMVFWPLAQAMRGATFYAVRTSIDPATVLPSIRAALEEVEPDMAVGAPATLDQRIGAELVRPRFQMLLLGIFGGLAFLIAIIGVYGVISYSVARRSHEFGVRVALGARRRHVMGDVLGKGLFLAAAGVLLGTVGAVALTRLMQSLLVEVEPTDPGTFVAVAASVLLVAVAAGLVPARRATRVDPMRALRAE